MLLDGASCIDYTYRLALRYAECIVTGIDGGDAF